MIDKIRIIWAYRVIHKLCANHTVNVVYFSPDLEAQNRQINLERVKLRAMTINSKMIMMPTGIDCSTKRACAALWSWTVVLNE